MREAISTFQRDGMYWLFLGISPFADLVDVSAEDELHESSSVAPTVSVTASAAAWISGRGRISPRLTASRI